MKLIPSPPSYPDSFLKEYRERLKRLKESGAGEVYETVLCDAGEHPENFTNAECDFASRQLRRIHPEKLLDVGSYRIWVAGVLAAGYPVTSVDVRERTSFSNEALVLCDASRLALPDASFDAVSSLCALEHFGLGRYGDPFDVEADKKALSEMARVLKPGGRLILTTTLTRRKPGVDFNAHRLYNHTQLSRLLSGLTPEEEACYSTRLKKVCPVTEATDKPKDWDVYLGCWRK